MKWKMYTYAYFTVFNYRTLYVVKWIKSCYIHPKATMSCAN